MSEIIFEIRNLSKKFNNVLALNNVSTAIYRGEVKDEQTERLVKAVGFKLTERGTYEVNLEGFFTDHCHKD